MQVPAGSGRPGTSQYIPPKHSAHKLSSVTSVALEYVPKIIELLRYYSLVFKASLKSILYIFLKYYSPTGHGVGWLELDGQ